MAINVKCEFPDGCGELATWVGLLQVCNPTPAEPEGVQRNVLCCERHSHTWSGLWGVWELTLENVTKCPHSNPECILTGQYHTSVLHSRCAKCAKGCGRKVSALGARFCSPCMGPRPGSGR